MLSAWRRKRRGRRCPRAQSRRRNAAIRNSLTPPRSERCPAGSGLRASPWSRGAAAILALLSSSSSGRPSSASVKAVMLAAGCTYRDVAPLPPKKDPHDTIGGYHADVPSLSTPTKGALEHLAALRRRALPLLGGLGLLHLRRQPPPGRAQRGARWRDHVVGPEGLCRDDREAARPSTTAPRTACSGRPTRPSATRSRSPPGPGTRRPTTRAPTGSGHIAICPSYNQHAFTTFRNAYRGQGPEGIPLVPYDEPGQGPTQ